MKIDRLLAILTLLLDKETVTAPELADYFEVSRRTINRDIEALNLAGFPIVTKQGSGGGISLLNHFKLDRSLLKEEELSKIISGLKGLESVSNNSNIKLLLKKLTPGKNQIRDISENITIDLASFYKNSLSEKIEIIELAIKAMRCIEFYYYSNSGESLRLVEPYKIIYKWSDWYLFAYCRKRSDFRMFKLNRLWEPTPLLEKFEVRSIPVEKSDYDSHLDDNNEIEVLFNNKVKYLLVESYGPNCFTETDDGLLHYRGNYTNKDFIIRWILGFGDKAQVVKPESIKKEIRAIALGIVKNHTI